MKIVTRFVGVIQFRDISFCKRCYSYGGLKCWLIIVNFNVLKPSGHYMYRQWSLYVQPTSHYMYHQFNIQQFYVLPTQCICVFCVALRTKQRLFPYTALTDWFV